MDLSIIQNVSAAALRSKGRAYPVLGAAGTGRTNSPSLKGDPFTARTVFNAPTAKSASMPSETLAAVKSASAVIQKQNGLITYAKEMQAVRERRFRTRYDLLI